MGAFDGAAGAAGRVDLLWRVHFGGRRSVASSARDDPLDVLRPACRGHTRRSRLTRVMLFVRDGNIYTSGGITAGIDLALALVEEDLGQEVMLGVARTMVVFPRRPGGQSQFSAHTISIGETNRPDISELRSLDAGASGSRFERAGLGGSHGDEPAQFFATLS